MFKGAVARYCACTAMIDSGSWLIARNGVPRQCESCGILKSSLQLHVCLKTKQIVWPVTFYLKNKESDRRATMASNHCGGTMKKNIVCVGCEAVIF